MDFAYKVPKEARAQVLAKKNKEEIEESPFEEVEEFIPDILKTLHNDWAKAGGPQNEDEQHLFDHLPKFIESLIKGDDVSTMMKDPDVHGIVLKIVNNPQQKESSFDKVAIPGADEALIAGEIALAPEEAALAGEAIDAAAPVIENVADEAGNFGSKILNWGGKELGKGALHGIEDLLGGGKGGQGGQQQGPIDPQQEANQVISSFDRSLIEDDAGILVYAAKDLRMEQLREQVRASLEAWANSSNDTEDPDSLPPSQYAIWWALYNAATTASDVATLAGILSSVPIKYHKQGTPQIEVPDGQGGTKTQTGLSPSPNPDEMNEAKQALPVTINPNGSQPESAGSEDNYIPGAFSSVRVPEFLKFANINWKLAAAESLTGGNPANPSMSPLVTENNPITNPSQMLTPSDNSHVGDLANALNITNIAPGSHPSLSDATLSNPSNPVNQFGAAPTSVATSLTTPNGSSSQSPTQSINSTTTGVNISPPEYETPTSAGGYPLGQSPGWRASSAETKENIGGETLTNGEIIDPEVEEGDGKTNKLHVGSVYELSSEKYSVAELVKVASIEEEGVVVETLKEGIKFFVTAADQPTFIEKTASMVSTREQDLLINEQGIARNLDRVELKNSHYENEFPDFYSKLTDVIDYSRPLSNSLLFDDGSLFL